MSNQLRSIAVYLLKSHIKEFDDALKDVKELKRLELKKDLPFEGALFLAPQRKREPLWLPFLDEGTIDELPDLVNMSTSAVLLIQTPKRVFGLPFGYGASLINPEAVERSFGLKVVLNSVDPANLKSVDAKTIRDLTVYTRRQASRGSPLHIFDIDTQQDILSGVAGRPEDTGFGTRIAGSDAVRLSVAVEFADLGSKCNDLFKAFRKRQYKRKGFGFVDHITSVRDPDLIACLDERLIALFASDEDEGIHLAPPEVIDPLATFSFFETSDAHADLELDVLRSHIRDPKSATVGTLKRKYVFEHSDLYAEPRRRWSVYRCVVGEVKCKNRRYVLSGGEWFEIAKGFVQEIDGHIANTQRAKLGLPVWKVSEKKDESAYNRYVKERKSGYYLADRKCLRIDGSDVELCDLFTRDGQFIHVKKWSRSATLSHLFAQGVVSAECLVADGSFRADAKELMVGQAKSLAKHFPRTQPNPRDYEVVYAIAMKKGRDLMSLPFFSRLNAVRAIGQLGRMGFNPRLELVTLVE